MRQLVPRSDILRPQALRRLGGLVLAIAGFAAAASAQTLGPTVDGPPKPAPKTFGGGHFTTWSAHGVDRGSGPEMGVFATSGSSAVNLAAPGGGLVDGPSGSLFETAAGLGWHSGHMSAMFGYMKPSSVKSATYFRPDSYTPAYKTSARVGVGWSLHF